MWVSVFYGLTAALIAAACLVAGFGPLALLGPALAALHFAWQVRTLRIDDPANCHRLFKANRDAGLLVLAGLILGTLTI